MTIKELDLQNAVYGDIPQSFQHRVQYALHRTEKEEVPVKRFTLRTALITLLLITMVGVALAAISSITAERYGQQYGEAYKNALLQSDIDASLRTKQLGDVIYQLDDVIVTGITMDNEKDNQGEDPMSVSDLVCSRIYATGTIRTADDANAVLICEDYLTTDPWNYSPYHNGGRDTIPAGAISVKDKAAATNADILCVRASANGLVGADGEFIEADCGGDVIVQEDGTMVFFMEIDLADPIPRQEEYTISMYLSNRQVTPEGEHLMDTRIGEDWVFTISPTKASDK